MTERRIASVFLFLAFFLLPLGVGSLWACEIPAGVLTGRLLKNGVAPDAGLATEAASSD